MKSLLGFLALAFLFSSCTTTYYIVRHAEKQNLPATDPASKDPSLTEAGKHRAIQLQEWLKNKKIGYVFSTNTNRTRETAEPTAAWFHLAIETYKPTGDPAFLGRLKSLKKNALIVGHSNTVDDLVNKLCDAKYINGDLPETEYDNLFIVKRKGKKFNFERSKLNEGQISQ